MLHADHEVVGEVERGQHEGGDGEEAGEGREDQDGHGGQNGLRVTSERRKTLVSISVQKIILLKEDQRKAARETLLFKPAVDTITSFKDKISKRSGSSVAASFQNIEFQDVIQNAIGHSFRQTTSGKMATTTTA